MNPKITVIGSINMDLVIELSRIPRKGETIIGDAFHQFPGGKGANQAVAAARLGAEVSLIGCIGKDAYGDTLKRQLANEGINIDGLDTSQDIPTGIAQITVTDQDNSIIVIPGANHKLSESWIERNKEIIKNADIILTQLEIPLPIIERVVEIADTNKIPVILNPAPAKLLPNHVLNKITYLTPNETEIGILTFYKEKSDYTKEFDLLEKQGVKHVILTRGEKGIIFKKNNESKLTIKKSMKVQTIDSTGAGDAFNGALAFAIGSKKSLEEAVDFSIKMAALSVTKLGAQSGMPYFDEII